MLISVTESTGWTKRNLHRGLHVRRGGGLRECVESDEMNSGSGGSC